jgi:YVTN family beta-propeller protein
MKSLSTSLILLAATLTALAHAQQTPGTSLLALSKRDHTLAIVDPSTLKVIAKAPVGTDPHEVIASTDGKTAYVSIYGNNNTISVIDLIAQKPLPTIDLGPLRSPHGLDFVGGKLWFTAEAAKAIGSYDPASSKVDWILGTGQNRTHMVAVSPDLKTIVTTNVASGTVSIIEKTAAHFGGLPPGAPNGPPQGAPPRGGMSGPPLGPPGFDWNETVVKVGSGSEGFDITPDRKEIWVANAGDGTISIIDFASKQVTQTLAANVPSANRLKFTPDGKLALVSMLRGGDVAVIDTSSRETVRRIPVGHGSAGILMQPDGSRAFVACTPDNYIAVIDLRSLQVVAHIESGPEPDGLAWAVRQ